jgi:two-component system, OmpR family, sensor histidine kinase VicK
MTISLRVLFVEDSEADTQIVLQALYSGGYEPIYQRVDSAVMMQLALQQAPWDLIICNYCLPNFSALDALQILKTSGLDLPFIVLSSLSGEDVAVEMMRAGASDYLFKWQFKRLIPAIARELREADLRRAKRQAEASAFQLAAIVESSEDAIISTDLQGRVLTWNPGAEQLYGYLAEEAKGNLLTQLLQPQNILLSASSELAVANENYDPPTIDCRQVTHRRKSGELIEVLLTVSLIKDANGMVVGLAMIAKDNSERQMIQRMKDEFVSIINHELRTPLTSLQGSVDLLLTGKLGELSEQGLRMLNIAANNIDRLVQLTSNILDFESLSSGKIAILKHPCDISELVNQTVAAVQAMAGQQGIELLVLPKSVQVCLDAKRIGQVLHHLLANAIRFSNSGGRVWLEVELREDGKVDSIKKPYVLVKVRDEGPGIPPDKLEAIFGQFQQADASDTRRQGGAGLGLAICRSIVQQHQGRLWVESTIGQGSIFYLALPVQRVAVQA